MNILINFSGKNFEESRLRLNASARKFGIDNIRSYDREFITNSRFYQEYKSILSHPKGLGYWLWKPFLIRKTLDESSENDIIIYSDSGIEIIADLSLLIDICIEKSIVLFANDHLKNKRLIKRDCYILMNCDEGKYRNGRHIDASFCLFRNTPFTRKLVTEWLHYCSDERIISDQRNVMGKNNFWGFKFHRHDQSVLSLLAIKYNLELFRQPSQYGNHYKMQEYRIEGERNCINQFNTKQVNFYSNLPMKNSPYFQLLDHHRKKSEIVEARRLNLIQKVNQSGRRRFLKIVKFLRRQ